MEKKMWARAKWLEGKKIRDDAIPANWVDAEKKLVYWPRININKSIADHAPPESDWRQFQLLAKKLEDDDEQVCVDYNFTTEAESDSDINDMQVERVGRKDNKRRKNLDSLNSLNDLDNANEDVPTPPSPLQAKQTNASAGTPSASAPSKVRPSASTPAQDTPAKPIRTCSSNSASFMGSYKETWGSSVSNAKKTGSQPHIKRVIAKLNCSAVHDVDEEITPKRACLHEDMQPEKQCDEDSFGVSEEELRENSRQILKYAKKSFRLLTEIKNLLKDQANMSVTDGQPLFTQAESIEEVDDLEELFLDEEKKKGMVAYFQGIGGTDFKDHTKSIMKKLFADEVMAKMNMLGGGDGEKKAFAKMKLYQIVLGIDLSTMTADNLFINVATDCCCHYCYNDNLLPQLQLLQL